MKTVLITGANKGIGYETARQLLERGFHLILTARNAQRGNEAAKSLNSERVEFLLMDVANEQSIRQVANTLSGRNIKLDVLINNAGILEDKVPITKVPADLVRKTFETNTVGPLLVIQHFLPLMNEGARIINISSGLGALSEMSDYAPAYSISKTALNAVTKLFSLTLADKKISINSMGPGWVRTDMGGANAERPVEKGAETVVWLADEADPKLSGKFFRDKEEIDW